MANSSVAKEVFDGSASNHLHNLSIFRRSLEPNYFQKTLATDRPNSLKPNGRTRQPKTNWALTTISVRA